MTIKVLDARFLTTATAPKHYPEGQFPEIAFVGRSNVGKSSMINALARRKKLVRVSNTPGRTRTLNFFDVDVERNEKRQTLRFCDLPGYGFAKASKTEKASWEKMISTYLEKREPLEVVVSIIDGEIGPSKEDQNTLDYLAEKVPRVLLVATKIDRLPKAKRKPRILALSKEVGLPLESVLPFSAVDGIGVQEVWETLLDVVVQPRG